MDTSGWNDDTGGSEERNVAPRPTRRALRLTFEFDGDNVKLGGIERLEKLVPPMTASPPEADTHSGEWLQLHDDEDRPVFTRLLHDPLRTRVEVHDPETGPALVVGPPGQGRFDVLVPDLPEAATVVLYASQITDERTLRPAAPIGRFDIRRPDGESESAS